MCMYVRAGGLVFEKICYGDIITHLCYIYLYYLCVYVTV